MKKYDRFQGLAIGTVAKIYLSYETPWWPNNFTSFVFVWNENDRQEYENDVIFLHIECNYHCSYCSYSQ